MKIKNLVRYIWAASQHLYIWLGYTDAEANEG